jgi:hypothetical protein
MILNGGVKYIRTEIYISCGYIYCTIRSAILGKQEEPPMEPIKINNVTLLDFIKVAAEFYSFNILRTSMSLSCVNSVSSHTLANIGKLIKNYPLNEK